MRVDNHVLDGHDSVESPKDSHVPSALTGTAKSPEALIEEARQRQRRRRLWVVIAALAIASAVVIGLLASGGSGSAGSRPGSSRSEGGGSPAGSRTNSSAKSAVDVAATPKGWVPVAYGNAQVSVPASWGLFGGCPLPSQGTGQGQVLLAGLGPIQTYCMFDGTEGNFVGLGPGSDTSKGVASVINGVTVYNLHAVWNVPSLGVQLSLTGPLGMRVLQTLTHSPRSVALAPGPTPLVPATWHRVTFGGLSVAVPKDWPEQKTTLLALGYCGAYTSLDVAPPAVELESGDQFSAFHCAAERANVAVSRSVDGLFVDPGPYSALRGVDGFGPCIHLNDLTACPTTDDLYGVLVLAVHIPGRGQPVAVQIGLQGTGETARTILDSMEKA